MDLTYSELAKNLVGPLDKILLDHAEGIRSGDMESVAVLAKIIALGGLAMSLSHATTPMSGFEHVMSHVLDLQAEIDHAPLAVHGSQVALATLAGTEMYQRFLADFDPAVINLEACYPSMDSMQSAHRGKFRHDRPIWQSCGRVLGGLSNKNWKNGTPTAQTLKRSSKIGIPPLSTAKGNLFSRCDPANPGDHRRAGPLVATHAIYNEKQAGFAFMNASLMRKRLTLGDLLIFTDWDRESLWQEIWPRYA